MQQSTNIDDYIAQFSPQTQSFLQKIRNTIQEVVPEAEEAIKYGIPTFVLNGNLVHFGAFKNHIGFYPTPSGLGEFKADLSKYKGAKGSVQFPLNEPILFDLIKRITQFRADKLRQKRKPSKTK